LEPVIQERVDTLLCIFREHRDGKKPLDLSSAYRSVAADTITGYSFPKSYNLLESPDLGRKFHAIFREIVELGVVVRQYPIVLTTVQSMPRWLLAIVNPGGLMILDFLNVCLP
jgi:hypothetical protein